MPRISKAELRWKCRRGMLELDLLLNRFLDKHYDGFDAQTESTLLSLLDYPDQVLHDLLVSGVTPTDADIAKLVARIRQAAQ